VAAALITTGALVVMAMVASAGARAADDTVFETGNDLYRDCTSVDLRACIGYIKGINDAMATASLRGNGKCVPNEVTGGEVVDAVIAIPRAHPERRPLAGLVLVSEALAEAFPCR
jgi:hypothetical protein